MCVCDRYHVDYAIVVCSRWSLYEQLMSWAHHDAGGLGYLSGCGRYSKVIVNTLAKPAAMHSVGLSVDRLVVAIEMSVGSDAKCEKRELDLARRK